MLLHFVILFRNKAIADYLASNGYTGTLAEFQKEADMVSSDMCRYLYAFSLCPKKVGGPLFWDTVYISEGVFAHCSRLCLV